MENQQQEATAAESNALPPTPSSQPKDPASTKEPRHGSSWAMRLAVLVALLMGGSALAGGYYLYQQLVEQYHYTLSVDEKQSDALKDPLSRLGRLEQGLKQIAQLESELGRLTADQSALERRLTNLSQKTPDDWLIAEADYLVRMAGRKLWLEQDPATALSLLKAADERIAAMQQPSLFSLRKALAADMEQVASVRSTDIAGNVYALDEIMKRIEQLTPGRNKQEYTAPTDETISGSLKDWQTNLAKSWKALINDFVTVRQRTGDITPLLSPEQEWYLKENIRTKLLQAQLALYRHDELSFREAVLMASGWVKLYFSVDSGTGAQILERLDALASLRIDAVPISKFQSSDMLRTLAQEGVKAPLPMPSPAPTPTVNPLPEPDQEPEPSAAAESEAEA
ncbi:uroporphyrinogen-III C-methyltransferase [Shewanella litorisediminis]|uniref:Uroporphyrinogen-III C-methyltransferase n=1 Tax=Shewanella litorisediminis TaxID=1173586 RepID=A0ABX7G2B7_9GAMM|nr:uroporphyrinogen-III C-methyltransferase [Shewanella litorisediminis]MCL2918646.1 uroporphyrinogen-III C-methyltransferase [Shewanella litorisediminis]QRH01469.1 uroporphyrinogen-III C-methyltransferase [Shewanella litorisediminis]